MGGACLHLSCGSALKAEAQLQLQRSDMERKTPPRKTLRTLFSRTDPGPVLDGSAQKEDRKRFKFPKLKIKSRKEAEALQEVR